MRPFLITVGTVFALIVVAHVARMAEEPNLIHEPWFWLMTLIAAALSAWSWRLWWTLRVRRGSQ